MNALRAATTEWGNLAGLLGGTLAEDKAGNALANPALRRALNSFALCERRLSYSEWADSPLWTRRSHSLCSLCPTCGRAKTS